MRIKLTNCILFMQQKKLQILLALWLALNLPVRSALTFSATPRTRPLLFAAKKITMLCPVSPSVHCQRPTTEALPDAQKGKKRNGAPQACSLGPLAKQPRKQLKSLLVLLRSCMRKSAGNEKSQNPGACVKATPPRTQVQPSFEIPVPMLVLGPDDMINWLVLCHASCSCQPNNTSWTHRDNECYGFDRPESHAATPKWKLWAYHTITHPNIVRHPDGRSQCQLGTTTLCATLQTETWETNFLPCTYVTE